AEVQLGNRHVQQVGGRCKVVQFIGFEDVVENVGADDNAVLPGSRRREVSIERGGVEIIRIERAGMADPADRLVAEVPRRVGGEVGSIAPGTGGRVDAVVFDCPLYFDGVASHGGAGNRDAGDDQVR